MSFSSIMSATKNGSYSFECLLYVFFIYFCGYYLLFQFIGFVWTNIFKTSISSFICIKNKTIVNQIKSFIKQKCLNFVEWTWHSNFEEMLNYILMACKGDCNKIRPFFVREMKGVGTFLKNRKFAITDLIFY